MTIDLSNLDITTPMFKPNGTTALTLTGNDILAKASAFVWQTDNGVMFYAPVYGAATSSVHRTRCEWKESDPWALQSQEQHTNLQRFTLHEINSAMSVVVSQTHDDNTNSPMAKVFVQINKSAILSVMAGVRTKRVSTDPAKEDIFVGFELDKECTIKQVLDSKAMTLEITVTQGSRTETKVWNLDPAWNSTELVFHGGVYNQINMVKEDTTCSMFELFELDIKHCPKPVVVVPPVEPVKDEYELVQARLDAIQDEYFKALKALQSSTKTQLNQLTTDMKALADKTKTAPIYVEIKDFKLVMENSFVS